MIQFRAKAKVCDLDMAITAHEKIFGLKVTVNDLIVMEITEASENFLENRTRFCFCQIYVLAKNNVEVIGVLKFSKDLRIFRWSRLRFSACLIALASPHALAKRLSTRTKHHSIRS
jgi:hypothetical protein